MTIRLSTPAILLSALCLPLAAQTNFEYVLSKHKGNKIVLLGEWRAEDIGKWKAMLDAAGIYEHGFSLLSRGSLSESADSLGSMRFGIKQGDVGAFESWVHQRYGLSRGARWATIGLDGKLMSSGTQVPAPKEFEAFLDQRGIKSPLRKVRDFLRENPSHREAMADLLKEVRRRALHLMPTDTSEDLGTEKDLLTWGVLANETDKIFSGDWAGLELPFFAPHKPQPEKFSPLMRNVFRKHIPKIEDALRLNPADDSLWDIWGWMARSQPSYRWDVFINSIETFDFPIESVSCPSSAACVWIVEQAKAKGDWAMVAKFAERARGYSTDTSEMARKIEWSPAGVVIFNDQKPIEGYPDKSAFQPHLEALLRLGDIEGANRVYDELLRSAGVAQSDSAKDQVSTGILAKTKLAADVAKSLGMQDIAKIWELGRPIHPIQKFPEFKMNSYLYRPYFYIFADMDSDFFKRFVRACSGLYPRLNLERPNSWKDNNLGWEKDDGERWGLFGGDNSILAQGTTVPDLETLRSVFRSNDIVSSMDYFRVWLREKGSNTGIELLLAGLLISYNNVQTIFWSDGDVRYGVSAEIEDDVGPDSNRENLDAARWGEAAKLLSRLLGSPNALYRLDVAPAKGAAAKSQLMKSLSSQYLNALEPLIETKPSDERLWNNWLFWWHVSGDERPLEPLVERLAPSPLSPSGDPVPISIMDEYYESCVKNGNWPKVQGLLKTVWDRQFERMNEAKAQQEENLDEVAKLRQRLMNQSSDRLGDQVGMPLIEAYLRDNRPIEADEIFKAWLDSGKQFKDIAKLVELAKELGQERLARDWEAKAAKK